MTQSIHHDICSIFKTFLIVLLSSTAHAQTPSPLATDINESVIRVRVSATNLAGKRVSGNIALTLYKPSGNGPFPLVVINHGRAEDIRERAKIPRYRLQSSARFFVRKGFAVAVPTRLGYGDTVGVGDPETRGAVACDKMKSAGMLGATEEIKTVVEHMRREPYVDPKRLLLVGESVGGYITVAANAAHIPGLIAAINFSGGTNGNPPVHYGVPCGEAEILSSISSLGQHSDAPMLWLYSENDGFFGPAFARKARDAYVKGGGRADLIVLPPIGKEGHNLIGQGNDIWQPIVDNFLAQFGFNVPGTLRPIAPTRHAALEDIPNVPSRIPAREDLYRRFLTGPIPRALAIGDRWAYAQGDDAPSRALGSCQMESTSPCKLYAVDNDVVWHE